MAEELSPALVGGPDLQAHMTQGAIVWVSLVACLPMTMYTVRVLRWDLGC